MTDPAQLDLVRKALTSGLSNCVEWVNDKMRKLVRDNPANLGLTKGGSIEQRAEDREFWQGKRDFWYFVVVPIADSPHGLFVEMELIDDDPDVPMVLLLNAHPQSR